MQKIDIVIPVYNAVDYVERCVISLLKHIPEHIHNIILFDDASKPESKARLKKLTADNVLLFHSPVNEGFGKTVNKAVGKATTEFVLVLNSDVEAENDFLNPLMQAMQDPHLLAVNPVDRAHPKYDVYDCSKGYITTFALSGYAFLIKRQVFLDVGGFDAAFGRGYYEDSALARALCATGGHTGIVPHSVLPHHGSKSFSEQEISDLLQRNQSIFRQKYPGVARRVLLCLPKIMAYSELNEAAKQACIQVCRDGGRIVIFNESGSQLLPVYRFTRLAKNTLGLLLFINRSIVRGHKRPLVRTNEVWLFDKTTPWLKLLIQLLACFYPIKVKYLQTQD